MIDIQSIADLELLRESVDLECKLAAGRDGQGALSDTLLPKLLSGELSGWAPEKLAELTATC